MSELAAMSLTQRYAVSFGTIVYKEVARFMRIWLQTILPPAITMARAEGLEGHARSIDMRINNGRLP